MPDPTRFINVMLDALCESVGLNRSGHPDAGDPTGARAQYPHLRGRRLDGIELRGPDACAWMARHLDEPTYARRGVVIKGLGTNQRH